MKKFFYSFSAAMMLAAGITAIADTGQVTNGRAADAYNPIKAAESDYQISQTLYLASEMSAATNNTPSYNIQALTYTVTTPLGDFNGAAKVYLSAVDLTELESPGIPEDQWTLVYDGQFGCKAGPTQDITLNLDTPFAMEDGKGLVITFIYKAEAKDYINFACTDGAGSLKRSLYYTSWSEENFPPEKYSAEYYPGRYANLGITYATGSVNNNFKLGLELDGPTDASVGTAVTYTVDVTNNGDADVSDYTIAIIDGNDNTLGSVAGPALAKGASDSVQVPVNFPEKGSYTVTAKAIQGDNVPSISNQISVNVIPNLPDNIATMTLPKGETAASNYISSGIINANYTYSGCQSLFPSSYFSDFTGNLEIYSLAFTMAQQYNNYDFDIQISLAQTERTDGYTTNPSFVPEDEFTVVYEGTFQAPVETESNPMTSPTAPVVFYLDEPFTLEKGKSLVMNVNYKDPKNGDNYIISMLYVKTDKEAYTRGIAANWIQGATPDGDTWMTVYDNNSNGRFRDYDYLPVVTFQYAAAAVPEEVDLALSINGEWPEEAEMDVETRFPVTIENKGTVDIESCTLLLGIMKMDPSNPGVMGEPIMVPYEIDETIPAGGKLNYTKMKYTFTESGYYGVGAMLSFDEEDDDVDPDNNNIEMELVTVAGLDNDLKAVSIAPAEDEEEPFMIGEEVTFDVTVANVGMERANGFTVEIVDADSNEVLASEVVNIAFSAGQSAPCGIGVTFTEPGDYNIFGRVVYADDENTANNSTEPIEVSVMAPMPNVDLSITSVDIDSDLTVDEGQAIEVTVGVKNNGMERVNTFTLQIESQEARAILGQVVVENPILPLAQDYYAVPVTFTANGTYNILARVIAEDDEDVANDTSAPITVNVTINDGIANIAAEIEAGNVYNMQGIRVTEKNIVPGIYIINGKRVMVK